MSPKDELPRSVAGLTSGTLAGYTAPVAKMVG